MSRSWTTQLNASSMLLASIDGLGTMFLYELHPRSHCWVGVGAIMWSSMDNRCARDPNWLLDIAPLSLPILAMRCASIFSNILRKHDSREMGRRFFGCEVLVCPGFGMGTY